MVIYECPRCGYTNNLKHHFLKHLERANICKLSQNGYDIDPREYKDIIVKGIVSKNEFFNFIRRSKENMETQLVEYKEKYDIVETQLVEYMEKNKLTESELVDYKEKYEIVELELVDYKEKTETIESELVEYKKKTETMEIQLVEYRDKVETVDIELVEYKEKTEMLELELVDYKEKVEMIECEMVELKEQLVNISNQVNTINGDHVKVVDTDNSINITINNYNEPNLDHITASHYKKFMKDYNTAYLEMCREIYFNSNVPENNSLRKTNKKDNYISYYKNGKWKLGNIRTIIPEIREVLYEALDKESADDRLAQLANMIDNDPKFRNKIDTDIVAQCYTGSNQ